MKIQFHLYRKQKKVNKLNENKNTHTHINGLNKLKE